MSRRDGERREELDRIRQTFTGYAGSGYADRWASLEPGMVLAAAERDRWLVDALRPLGPAVIVDLGCGDGNVAVTLDRAGLRPSRYVGVDLIAERIGFASEAVPWGEFHVGPADELPLPDASVDAVVTMTMLSSIISPFLREMVAAEVSRVLRPGGQAAVYDLRIRSPRNPAVRPVGMEELQKLFPGWPVSGRSLTVLPPLARSALAGGPMRYRLLSAVPLLRSHIGAVLTKPG